MVVPGQPVSRAILLRGLVCRPQRFSFKQPDDHPRTSRGEDSCQHHRKKIAGRGIRVHGPCGEGDQPQRGSSEDVSAQGHGDDSADDAQCQATHDAQTNHDEKREYRNHIPHPNG